MHLHYITFEQESVLIKMGRCTGLEEMWKHKDGFMEKIGLCAKSSWFTRASKGQEQLSTLFSRKIVVKYKPYII